MNKKWIALILGGMCFILTLAIAIQYRTVEDANKVIDNISGTIYVARDAAHKRMQEMLDKKIELPFELKNNIYNKLKIDGKVASFRDLDSLATTLKTKNSKK